MLTLAAASPQAVYDDRLRVQPLHVHEPRALTSLLGGGQLAYLCMASGHLRRIADPDGLEWPEDTMIAVAPDGIVGFAVIERESDAEVGRLTVGLDSGWVRGPAAGRLLEEAAQLARRLGMQRLETQVARQTSFALFQEAGLRTVSSMPMGGVTDVALSLG